MAIIILSDIKKNWLGKNQRERLSSDIGSSPFFVYVLRDDSDKNYPHEICKANTHTEK